MSFARYDNRDIGRYEEVDLGFSPGFNMGIIIDFFQLSGIGFSFSDLFNRLVSLSITFLFKRLI